MTPLSPERLRQLRDAALLARVQDVDGSPYSPYLALHYSDVVALLADVERWRMIKPHLHVDADCTDHSIPECWQMLFLREENDLVLNGGWPISDVDEFMDAIQTARCSGREAKDGDAY